MQGIFLWLTGKMPWDRIKAKNGSIGRETGDDGEWLTKRKCSIFFVKSRRRLRCIDRWSRPWSGTWGRLTLWCNLPHHRRDWRGVPAPQKGGRPNLPGGVLRAGSPGGQPPYLAGSGALSRPLDPPCARPQGGRAGRGTTGVAVFVKTVGRAADTREKTEKTK